MTAAEKVQRAKVQTTIFQPFFASLVLRLDVDAKPDEWFAQRGLNPDIATDGKAIYYSEAFIDTQTLRQVEVLLAHEVCHGMLHHSTRRDWRDKDIWNQACVAEDTLILMADGTSKEIRNVVPGESIATPFGPSVVIRTLDKGIHETMELSGDICGKLVCTPDHQILTDRGFLHAEELNNPTQGWFQNGTSWVKRTDSSKLQNHEHEAVIGTDEDFIHVCFGVSSQKRAAGQAGEVALEATEPGAGVEVDTTAIGVLSRADRWRGDSHDTAQQAQERDAVFSMQADRNEHILRSLPALGETGVYPGTTEEQHEPSILEPGNNGLSNGLTTAEDRATLGDQENSRRIAVALHHHTKTTEAARYADAGDVGHLAANTGAQQAWISIRERSAGSRRVFDLITEHHVYYANGILVHNCDFMVNQILKDAQYELPDGALVDPKYADKSAEQAYAILEKQAQKKPKGGQGPGKGGKGNPGQQPGSVFDSSDSAAERSHQEQEWQVAVQQAAQSAKQAGNLPASLERFIEKMKEPVIDWVTVLRQYFEECVPKDYRWFPPSRRYVAQGEFLPSVLKEGFGEIVIAVDTSGSIDQDMLAQFMSEINAISGEIKPTKTHVIYCDTDIGKVDEFGEGEEIVLAAVGGGGTSFTPPFTYCTKKGINPRAFIYLTDLQGDCGAPEPEFPVLWVTQDKTLTGKFGETLRMPLSGE